MSWLSEIVKRNRSAIGNIVGAIPVIGGVAKAIVGTNAPGAPSVADTIKAQVDAKADSIIAQANAGANVLSVASQAQTAWQQATGLLTNPLVLLGGVALFLVSRGRGK